jgi:hypothetical protein
MRTLAFGVFWLMAGAACSSSNGTDRAGVFTGDWVGQGYTVENRIYAPVTGADGRTYPNLVSFRRITFTSDASGAVGLAAVYPLFVVSAEPTPMEPAPIVSGGEGLFLASPFTVSGPAPASCADTPCQDQTDTITVTGGSAALADGVLQVVLAGQRVLCCQQAAFTVAFEGTRAGSGSG